MMKKILYSAFAILGVFLLSSCNQDQFMELDKGHNTLQISVDKPEVILNEIEHSNDALEIKWTSGTNYGTGNKIHYRLEIDQEGNQFASPLVALENEVQIYALKYTVEDLNSLLKDSLSISWNETAALEARITATVPDIEEVQEATTRFKVTTYQPVTSTLYLIGDATPNGWSADKASEMTRKDNGVFTWIGNMKQGEFKFITQLGQFSPSYVKGEDGKLFYRTSEDQPDIKFTIDEYSTYQIDVNLLTGMISIKKTEGEMPAFKHLYFVGNPNAWSFEEMQPDVLDPFLFRMGRFFETGKGGEFKFATQSGSWENMYKATSENAPYTQTSTVFVHGFNPDNKWFLKDEECNKAYKICFDIRTGKERMMMLEFTPYPMIYLVGDATPNGWDLANATAMTVDPTSPYVFTWEGSLNAGELKFSCDRQSDWNGAWFMSVKPNAVPSGESERTLFINKSDDVFKGQYLVDSVADLDYKWKLGAAGTYKITLNQLNETVSIVRQ